MDDGQRTASQYDAMGASYSARNSVGSYNAYYERPATIGLLGDVSGRRVLEAGCGAGQLTAWLTEHGATVTAFDVSPVMAGLARERADGRAEVLVADLSRPLSFAASGGYDLVVASLALHYVRDWDAVLAEFRRVLTPAGAVVFSTHHPAMDWQLHSPEDYFAIRQVTETWQAGSGDFEVTFWRRPLTAMTEAIAAAGFVIERLTEPEPAARLAELDPRADHSIRTQPRFLFFRLRPARPEPRPVTGAGQ
ncbi:MAG: class I SAM-dependent methyltransferase [Streptosporangiaceae bacterium]